MNDGTSPSVPTAPVTQRPVTPAPVTSGETTPQGQAPAPPAGQAAPPPDVSAGRPAVTFSASLAGMAAGTRVDAAVIGHDTEGLPVVRTAGGTFVAATREALPPSTQLILEIQSTGTEIRAAIVTRNGQPLQPPPEIRLVLTNVSSQQAGVPSGAPGAAATLGTGPGGALATGAATPLPQLRPGAQVLGRAIAAAPAQPSAGAAAGAQPTPTGGAALAPGTPLLVRVTALGTAPQPTPPAGPAGGAPPGAAPQGSPAQPGAAVGTPQIGSQGAPGSATAAAAPGQPAPAAAKGVTAAATSPATSLAAGAPPRPAMAGAVSGTQQAPVIQLTGVVAGQGSDGRVLVQTPAGVLALDARTTARPGTPISVEVIRAPSAAPAPAAAVTASQQAALIDIASGWTNLREIVEVAQSIAPAVARQFIERRIPSLNARAASNVLFFIAALRGGDVTGWLGRDMLRVLERGGRRGLVDRLADDFGQLRRLADPDRGSEWRAVLFPFYDGAAIHPANMFVRGHRARPGEDGDDDLRFVVDLDLSALGAMQLDGLVRGKAFDLIVRSQRGLDPTMRQEISELFEGALGLSGLTGSLVFQTAPVFPIAPLQDIVAPERGGTVVA